MLIELISFVFVLLLCWCINFRPSSRNQLRPCYRTFQSPAELPRCDYAVVGAGVAGLAAAAALLRSTPDTSRVLLVESGTDAQPASTAALFLQVGRRDRLLSFSPDVVRVPLEAVPKAAHLTFFWGLVDQGYVAQRPWRFSKTEEVAEATASAGTHEGSGSGSSFMIAASATDVAKANRYRLLQYTPFPRGRGMGGTAQVDWGIHFNSLWTAKTATSPRTGTRAASGSANGGSFQESTATWARLPVRFPSIRNPLSWAFAEAVKSLSIATAYLPTPASPVKRGAVYPAYLYLDSDGKRLAMPAAIFGDIAPAVLRQRLCVLTGYTVVDVEVSATDADLLHERKDQPCLTGLMVRSTSRDRKGSSLTTTVPVEKGVVIAAGALHTPRLLYAVAERHKLSLPRPLRTTAMIRDVVALPLIFEALPAVSADSFNARDAKATVMWWLTQRGPFLTPLTDTLLSLPLPNISPSAEVRILFFPFGGRDPARFTEMGWDTVLGTALQAFTMLLVLQGIDGLEHELTLDSDVHAPGAAHARSLRPPLRVSALTEDVHRKVQEAFLIGFRECRRLTKVDPLLNLTREPGVEATDFTLLVPQDEGKATRLAQLSRLPPSRRSAKGKAELKELLQWSRQHTATEFYMRSYVDAHAYWLGFASGTSEQFLATSESYTMRISGLRNAVVGDCSAVASTMWSTLGGGDSLAAASRSTSVDIAERAVAELLSSIP